MPLLPLSAARDPEPVVQRCGRERRVLAHPAIRTFKADNRQSPPISPVPQGSARSRNLTIVQLAMSGGRAVRHRDLVPIPPARIEHRLLMETHVRDLGHTTSSPRTLPSFHIHPLWDCAAKDNGERAFPKRKLQSKVR